VALGSSLVNPEAELFNKHPNGHQLFVTLQMHFIFRLSCDEIHVEISPQFYVEICHNANPNLNLPGTSHFLAYVYISRRFTKFSELLSRLENLPLSLVEMTSKFTKK